LVIFDILVYDSNYLVGSTFETRVKLLDELYGNKQCDKEYLYNISENVYRVRTYTKNFKNLFNNLIKIGMYEGLVFKRMSGKLEMGLRELNTSSSQFKIRKPTRNYKY
jgi:ATP-dependent DNA ligase